MAEQIRIDIEAQDNASKALQDVRAQLVGMEGDIADVQAAQEELNAQAANQRGLQEEIQNLKSWINTGREVYQTAKQVYDETVGAYADYAKSVDVFSNAVGTTYEQGSRLIQLADNMGISAGEMQTAMLRAVKQGMDPTVGGLAKMADQYVAIKDPAERAKFLTDNFGRSSAELARLLEEGGNKIRANNKDLETRLILDEKAITVSREYEAALNDWNTTWAATKQGIGQDFMPKASAYLQVTNQMAKNIRESGDAWMRWVPLLQIGYNFAEGLEAGMDNTRDKAIAWYEEMMRKRNEAITAEAKQNYEIQHTGDEFEITGYKGVQAETDIATATENAARELAAYNAELKNETSWELAYTNAKDFSDRTSITFNELGSQIQGITGEIGRSGADVWNGLLAATGKISPAAIEEFVKIQNVMATTKKMLDAGMSVDVVVNWIMTQSGISTQGTGNPWERYRYFEGQSGGSGGYTYLGTMGGPGTQVVFRGPDGNNVLRPPDYGTTWHGAYGLDGIVPPGYNSDNFPVWVSSGERVQVTPRGRGGQTAPAGNTQQMNYIYGPVTLQIANEDTQADLLSVR